MCYISLKGVSIEAKLLSRQSRSLKLSSLVGLRLLKKTSKFSYTVFSNIDLELSSGDVVGLVGKNGVGKTTLLKAIAGIITPASGQLEVKGKIACILDNSAGFDENASGYQNIFLRGYTLGIPHSQLLIDQYKIIQISGLNEFIEQPLSKYSAGMIARLNFAVLSVLKYDILLLDEGIGAGDQQFRNSIQKEFDALFNRSGVALIATHDKSLIELYCNKVFQIKKFGIANVSDQFELK
jgi:ABC-2 type transport system ATP-binding protein